MANVVDAVTTQALNRQRIFCLACLAIGRPPVAIDRLLLLSHQPSALRVAEIASRLLGRPITAAAPVPAAAPGPFIAQLHGEFALMRAVCGCGDGLGAPGAGARGVDDGALLAEALSALAVAA